MRTAFLKILFRLLPIGLYRKIIFIPMNLSGYLHKRRNLDYAAYVDPTVQVCGWANVRVGKYSIISEDTFLNVNFREGSVPRIIIGNGCMVGKRNFFSSGPMIRLGDYTMTALDCHLLGVGHSFDDPTTPCTLSGLTQGGPIDIGTNCWLATGVTVLENVRVGFGSVIGARALVTKDVPPLSLVVGNPARVIKRFDLASRQWLPLDKWTAEHESNIPSEEDYAANIRNRYPFAWASLIAASKRSGSF